MKSRANFAVYIPVMGRPDDAAVEALAAVTGLSPADAKIALVSRIPRRVTSTATREEAEDRVLSLKGAGFDAFALAFEDLRAKPPMARSAQLLPDGIEFQPGGAFTAQDEICLILQGQILSSRSSRTEVSQSNHGVLVPVGKGSQQSGDAEQFVHVYGRTPSRAVEFRPRSFNFRFLGPDAGVSKAQALKNLIARLQGLFPGARVDDTLLHVTTPPEETGYSESFDEGALGSINSTQKSQSNEGGALRAALLLANSMLGRSS